MACAMHLLLLMILNGKARPLCFQPTYKFKQLSHVFFKKQKTNPTRVNKIKTPISEILTTSPLWLQLNLTPGKAAPPCTALTGSSSRHLIPHSKIRLQVKCIVPAVLNYTAKDQAPNNNKLRQII